MLGKAVQEGAQGWRTELGNEVEGESSPALLIVRLTLSHF